ncbi:hypothetical protein U9M48_031461 [Paspalum notatum var. saurae]|uniref:Reverse transcriptase domain-containing protein n=1 Tax=Paspalum notatum var. saurae TaxID=547442 RepID=A0AAQ3U392_PASNO
MATFSAALGKQCIPTNCSTKVLYGLLPDIINDAFTQSVPDKEEIWDIIKQMRSDASPGLDGFNAAFYKAAWPWIAEDVVQLVQNFYSLGYLPEGINKTSIALIPKGTEVKTPQNYKPISLCNVIYKIISTSLAKRIKAHLPNYIHATQAAFIPGRHITSNIIIAQEIAHSFGLKS